MRPLLLLLFLVCTAAATRLELLFLQDAARHTLLYYTEGKQYAQALALLFTLPPANASLARTHITSRGTTLPFFSSAAAATAPTLVVAAAGANPLWMRWRYATWDNWTLTLDAVRPPPRPGMTFSCGAEARDILCDAGIFTAAGRQVRVAFDPARARSAVSPRLYFLLSNGRARHNATETELHALARAAECYDFVQEGGAAFRLCERDAAGFDMLDKDAPYHVVLGAPYLAANFTQLSVDGWAGTLHAAYDSATDTAHTAYEIMGLLSAAVTTILVYGRWVTSPQTLSMGLLVRRAYGGLARSPPRFARRTGWVLDFRFNVGTLLLSASGITALVAGGLSFLTTSGYTAYPELTTFFLALAGFSLAQFAAALLLWIFTDLVRRRDGAYSYLTAFAAPITTAFARHVAHDGAALGFVVVALTPFMFHGTASGDRFFLFAILGVLLPLLFHQTYNALGLCILGFARTAGATWHLLAFGVWQLVLAVGLVAVTTVAFLLPLIAHSSAFFPAVLDMLAAYVAVALVVAGTAFLLSREIAAELEPPAAGKGKGKGED